MKYQVQCTVYLSQNITVEVDADDIEMAEHEGKQMAAMEAEQEFLQVERVVIQEMTVIE